MLKPTAENDREFWWVKTKWGMEVVLVVADDTELRHFGEPMFFWCGNEVEEPVSQQGLVWLGKVEPPCESSICEGDTVRTEIRGREFVGVVDEIVTEKSVKIDICEGCYVVVKPEDVTFIGRAD